MPAFTARLNLYLPGGGSLSIGGDDELADIDRINQGLQIIDEAVGIKDVNNSTIPSSPYPGQIVRNTDTGQVRFWNTGTGTWVQLKPHVGTSAPSSPIAGDLWVDTN